MPPIAEILPLFLVLILSLSVHEAAHAWTADRLGDPTARTLGRLTLNPLAHIDWIGTVLFPIVAMMSSLPLIGWAKPVPVNWHHLQAPRRDFATVALAGPASNLAIAAGAAALYAAADATAGGASRPAALFAQVASLNVFLAVFNLLPVPPLDGGNVLAGLVPEAAARLIDRLRPYGILILYAMMFTGVFHTVAWPVHRAIMGWLLP
ncbi:MAG: site-2 protease family protein [Acidobacteria bacterium]|nr:site-2 protease family protein [Acidobacteriota bacterium]